VDRKARQVEIRSIDLIEQGSAWLDLDVACGTGTYIRSLVADIAESLDTLGHLESLVRTEAAGWTLTQASELDQLDAQKIKDLMIPVQSALSGFLRVDVSEDVADRLSKGQRLLAPELQALGITEQQGSMPIWFCPPAGSPLILSRILQSDQAEPRMEIIRVLFPSKKTVDIPGS